MFETKRLPPDADAVAPDGSDVRILLSLDGGSVAHFQLGPGQTSVAVRHRSVEEIWYFVSGSGELWRKDAEDDTTVAVGPGTCITIPVGTIFQFRATSAEPLAAVGVTLPPWPGGDEAIRCEGTWASTVTPGPGLADG